MDLHHFLEATRDSGYRTFDAAIAELVDNSLQAGATRVDITLPEPRDDPAQSFITVLDNGAGMDDRLLVRALQFGGSHRFNDRRGLGRFGMGLPNSSLSQARRVEVYSWQDPRIAWQTYLDLDELLAMARPFVPEPIPGLLPKGYDHPRVHSGTLIVWRRLDRIKHSAWRGVAKKLCLRLGRKFRYFIWEGRTITVNGTEVVPFDPLFLSREAGAGLVVAAPFGDVLEYQVTASSPSGEGVTATVMVRLSELPVGKLAGLPSKDKRAHGIVNGAGISIVRAGREIDYGWFFLDKRRENYDDWWRGEIRFSPELDELFGVTHTKQGIRPSDDLREILSGDLTNAARALNRRVREAHMEFAAQQSSKSAVNVAAATDVFLKPVVPQRAALEIRRDSDGIGSRQRYRLVTEELDEAVFYRAEWRDGELTVVINTHHEFYRRIYQPLVAEGTGIQPALMMKFELLLLALGRTTCLDWTDEEIAMIRRFTGEWSRTVAVFSRGIGNGVV